MSGRFAILLAAGSSRRMGGKSKLDLPLGSSTILALSLKNLLLGGVDRVRIVAKPEMKIPDIADRHLVEVVTNSNPDSGLGDSLRVGLTDLPRSASVIIVALGDMPFIQPQTIELLVRTFEREKVPVVFPIHDKKRGHPVIWDVNLIEMLSDVQGMIGAKMLVERYATKAGAVEVSDPGVCFDIDSSVDYAKARVRVELT